MCLGISEYWALVLKSIIHRLIHSAADLGIVSCRCKYSGETARTSIWARQSDTPNGRPNGARNRATVLAEGMPCRLACLGFGLVHTLTLAQSAAVSRR